ncbi:ATP-binding cassette domain-containing protein [Candidatus Thorarchaeota archaeon]|jgi:oligopeptide/dipeptide ABC transporter ATP-binding protein|nr:MAG: ATP-binding cassette domain-containing protein [Candidatus Thorarchaeota archaeon]
MTIDESRILQGSSDVKEGDTLIAIKNMRKWFPVNTGFLSSMLYKQELFVKAVDGVTFDVKKGEVLVLAGESGCGKTTTGRCILHLEIPTDGDVVYAGQNLSTLDRNEIKELRKRMQITFQDPYESLNPKQSIKSIVEEPLLVHKIPLTPSQRRQRVLEALESVALTPAQDYIDRFPHELSGGQRQRISVARALILHPEFMVADEPVSMLDVSIRAEILNLLLNLREELDLTYLFITHDLAVATYIADRIGIMYLGKIMELGPAHEVAFNPYHPYTRALISAVPSGDPTVKRRVESLKGEPPSPINVPSGCRFHPRCPYAQEICVREIPEDRDMGEGHFVACHFAGELPEVQL